VAALRAAGLQTLATTVDGELDLDAAEAILGAPTAWLFGPESQGLPDDVAALADRRVRIPMPGSAESLNVAAAAAICMYQSARAARLGGDD
jgi:RNA methyltransferase, TrmH family